MPTVRTFAFVLAGGALLTSVLSAAALPPASIDPPPIVRQAEEHPGAEILVRICNQCHDSARIVEKRRTRDDWQNVLFKMIEQGAVGEDSEFETLFAYLCLNHGQVYINNAQAPEIVMVLGLSSKDAEAIVAFREKSGPFADLAALEKVPGVDVKAIEAKKVAILF